MNNVKINLKAIDLLGGALFIGFGWTIGKSIGALVGDVITSKIKNK